MDRIRMRNDLDSFRKVLFKIDLIWDQQKMGHFNKEEALDHAIKMVRRETMGE